MPKTMEYALRKAAEKNSELKAILDENDRIKKIKEAERIARKIREENERIERENREKEELRQKEININKTKKMFFWEASVMSYSFEAGIIYADSYDDAKSILFDKFKTHMDSEIERFNIDEIEPDSDFKILVVHYGL